MDFSLFPTRFMLLALKKANADYPELRIGFTFPALLAYERKGIVTLPSASTTITKKGNDWRFYTPEEIAENVKKVISYKKQYFEAIKEKIDARRQMQTPTPENNDAS